MGGEGGREKVRDFALEDSVRFEVEILVHEEGVWEGGREGGRVV